MADANYDSYGAWKQWGGDAFMQLSPNERNYFDDELRGIDLSGRDVLEIGFGNGNFLRWAKDKDAHLFGTEMLEEALSRAATQGVTTLPLDLSQSLAQYAGRFRLIAAFDVMEHLTLRQNEQFLDQVAQLLAPGGWFIARFPNGQSPFGRIYQHGDMTHTSTLSAEIAQQMILHRPFKPIHIGNPASIRASGALRRVGSRGRALGQKLVETAIRKLYGFSSPLGPNTVMLVERT